MHLVWKYEKFATHRQPRLTPVLQPRQTRLWREPICDWQKYAEWRTVQLIGREAGDSGVVGLIDFSTCQ